MRFNSNPLLKTLARNWQFGLAFVFALGLLAMVGCSDDTATTNTTAEFNEHEAIDNLRLTELLSEQLEEDQQTFAKVKPDQLAGTDATTEVLPKYAKAYGEAKYTDAGFTITLDYGAKGIQTEFVFPRNAVNEQTARLLATDGMIRISGEAIQDASGSYVFFYVCEPHGLIFDRPVAVNQSVVDKNGTLMGLFYNTQGAWYTLEEVKAVKNGEAQFHLWHFSKYGVSR